MTLSRLAHRVSMWLLLKAVRHDSLLFDYASVKTYRAARALEKRGY